MPAFENVTGKSRVAVDNDPQWRAIYAMFTSGYTDYLKGGDLYTDETGHVVQFKRRASWPGSH